MATFKICPRNRTWAGGAPRCSLHPAPETKQGAAQDTGTTPAGFEEDWEGDLAQLKVAAQPKPTTQLNEPRTDLADRGAIVLAEVGNRFVVGSKPSRQPHHLDVAASLALQAPARVHRVSFLGASGDHFSRLRSVSLLGPSLVKVVAVELLLLSVELAIWNSRCLQV